MAVSPPTRWRWFPRYSTTAAIVLAIVVHVAHTELPAAQSPDVAGNPAQPIPQDLVPLFEAALQRHEEAVRAAENLVRRREEEYKEALRIHETTEAKRFLRNAKSALKKEQADCIFRPPLLDDLNRAGTGGGLIGVFRIQRIGDDKKLECLRAGVEYCIEGVSVAGKQIDDTIGIGDPILVLPPYERDGHKMIHIRVLKWEEMRKYYEQWLTERDAAVKKS